MKEEDKVKFVEDVMESCKASLIRLIRQEQTPERWDEKELRLWIADYIKGNCVYYKMERREIKEYKNDLLINPNLI